VKINVLIPIIVGLILFSCAAPEDVKPNVRAALRATGTGSIRAMVFVEGADGNSLSGAVVTIRDKRNALLQLNYDSVACSYNGLMEELPGESSYNVEVVTILSKEKITLTVPYSRLLTAPEVIVFQDMAGNSVLLGQSIDSNQPVQIGWSGSGDGVVYQVTIRTALKAVYSVSTNSLNITVPAGSIPSGSYLLEISAQKMYGDAYFKTSSFFSLSYINASLVSCDVI